MNDFLYSRKNFFGDILYKEKFMEKEKPKKQRLLLYGAIALFCIPLFFRYLFSALVPFLTGFAAASFLHRSARKISQKLKIRYSAAAIGLTVFSVSVLLGLTGILTVCSS